MFGTRRMAKLLVRELMEKRSRLSMTQIKIGTRLMLRKALLRKNLYKYKRAYK